jgi:hypothetical protein
LPRVRARAGPTGGLRGLGVERRECRDGKAMGCEVIELDPARPFTAARARNEGAAWLGRQHPGAAYVQFLDGDTELLQGWIEKGTELLETRKDLCAAFGRLHERHPERSIYNRICDLEWKKRVGEVESFGGMCLMRVKAFLDAGGFDTGLIAGEEPEFAQRLRRAGWRIWSMDADMALHDVGITRFGEWWKRSVRTGHAYAQVFSVGTGVRNRFGLRQSLRTWFWIIGVPGLAALSWWIHPLAPLGFAGLLLLQIVKVGAGIRWAGVPGPTAVLYALLWWPAQLAQWFGQCKFLGSLIVGRKPRLIEYKSKGSDGSDERRGPS